MPKDLKPALDLLELLSAELNDDMSRAQTRDQHIRISLRQARVFEIKRELENCSSILTGVNSK